MNCIFCDIAQGIETKEFVYNDDLVMVFEDLHPVKPVHLLIVPKEHVTDFFDLKDDAILIRIKEVIHKLIKEKNLANAGYRIGVNGGGFQHIDHLHFHLIGPMGSRGI